MIRRFGALVSIRLLSGYSLSTPAEALLDIGVPLKSAMFVRQLRTSMSLAPRDILLKVLSCTPSDVIILIYGFSTGPVILKAG